MLRAIRNSRRLLRWMMARNAEPSPAWASCTSSRSPSDSIRSVRRGSAWGMAASIRHHVLAISLARNFPSPGLSAAHADRAQELLAGLRLVAERADHPAGDHTDVVLMYAAGGHAAVGGFDHHGDTLRIQRPIQCAGDLGRHPLLNLEPLRIDFNQARELGNPHNPVARQIGDVGAT